MLTNIEKYKYKPYNKIFKKYYSQEKQKLQKFLPKLVAVEHISSTAVPGLGDKGVIDIFLGANGSFSVIKNKLEKNEYLFIPQKIKEKRLFFRKDYTYKRKTRRVHLHLVK